MAKIDRLARMCYKVNRDYRRAVGDTSQLPWDQASAAVRESATDVVNQIVANPDITPTQLHKQWIARKEQVGYRYGEKKDAVKKTHPCLKPWKQLSQRDKMKGVLYISVVSAGVSNV